MFRMLWIVFSGIMKRADLDKNVQRKVKEEYKSIVERAADIGDRNRLLGSYGLAAFFIALNRNTGLDKEENYAILEDGLKNSRLYKTFMGDSKKYFSEKNMESRRKWSEETYRKKYKNDWVVDVLEKSDDYEFGFDYRECGVCKLCSDEGCPELAQYLCRLDFMTVEMMGIHLERTKTLAEGYDKCDFRFSRK